MIFERIKSTNQKVRSQILSGSKSTATKVPRSGLVTWKGSLALSLVVTLWEYAPTSLSFQHCYLMSSSIGCHCDDDGDGHDSDDSHGDELLTLVVVKVMSC